MMSRSFRVPLTKRRALSAGVTVAIAAMALVTGPASARADSCDQFAFANSLNPPNALQQSNGWFMWHYLNGQSDVGVAQARSSSGKTILTGSIKGVITGRDVSLDVYWDNGQEGRYTGTIADDGYATGSTSNVSVPGDTANWHSTTKFVCAQAPAPAQPPPLGPAKKLGKAPHKVSGDVDVYERPNINNDLTPLGILRDGSYVQLVGKCKPEDWCQVKGDAVPGGQGFVWGHIVL